MSSRKATLILGLLVVAAARGVPKDETFETAFGNAWQLVIDQGRAGVLTTGPIDREGTSLYGWLLTPITTKNTEWTSGQTRLVQATRRYVQVPAHADALRLTNGDWALVGDFHGGGTRVLQFARIACDILDPACNKRAHDAKTTDLITEVRVLLEPTGSEVRAQDLCRPRLLEHDRRIYVVASARYGEGIHGGITWVAEANPDNRALQARCVGEGVDPRVVRYRGEFICSVRRLRNNQTLDEAAPIELYRSADLQAWRPMGAVTGVGPSYDYDLLSDVDALWLSAVVDEGRPLGRLLKYDPASGTWAQQGTTLELPSLRAHVQLLRASATQDSLPSIVFRSVKAFERQRAAAD